MDILELKVVTFAYVAEKENLTKGEKLQILEFVKNASEKQIVYLLTRGRMLTENELLKEDDLTLPSEVLAGMQSPGPPVKVVVGKSVVGTVGDNIVKAVGGAVKRAGDLFKKGTPGEPEQYGQDEQGNLIAKKGTAGTPPGPLAGSETALIVTGAAGLLALGFLAYRKYFSKAARACKGQTGAARGACIRKFKAEAKSAELARINSLKGACSKELNPAKQASCRNKLARRAAKLQNDVKKLRMK